MRKEIADIKAFQKAFECNVLSVPTMPVKEIQELRVRLLQEELDELKQANEDGDIIEVADALVDIMYVLLGTACEYGLADLLPQAWDLVHESNMSKLDENGKPIRREDGKIIKPPTYKKVDLSVLFKQ
jgi:predicted HAD superfamily Cof-like phosphohydrolase